MKFKLTQVFLVLALILASNTIQAQNDSRIKSLSADSFKQDIKKGLVLVHFYADWASPCKMQTPILEEIASENNGKFTIAKLNVDDAKEIIATYEVENVPTLILFKKGKEVERLRGLSTKEKILTAVNNYL